MLRAIALNTAISFGGRVVAVILGLFSLAISTRLLGQEGFGLYSTALAWAYVFSFFADFGLYNLLVREVSRAKAKEEKRVVSDAVSLRLGSLLVFLSIGLAVAFVSPFNFGLSVVAIALASLQYFFLSMSQVLMGVFQKHLRVIMPTIAEIIGRVVTLGALVVLFYGRGEGIDYVSVLFIGVVGAGTIALINSASARTIIPFRLVLPNKRWKGMVARTFPIALSIILTALYFKLDTLFIAFFRSQEEAGLYNAAYKLLENMIFFPAAFVGIVMPQLSRIALLDRAHFTSLFQGAFDALMIITPALVLGIALEAESIIIFIAGNAFYASGAALEVLAFAMGMIFFGALFSQGLIALGLQKKLAWIYFFGAAFNIVANVLVVPLWGYIGASVTTLVTEALVTLLMISAIERAVPLTLRFGRALPVSLSAVAMGALLYSTNLPLLLSIMLGGIVYSTMLWLSGGITKEDIVRFITPLPIPKSR